jgi:hypothetical protein
MRQKLWRGPEKVLNFVNFNLNPIRAKTVFSKTQHIPESCTNNLQNKLYFDKIGQSDEKL